MRDGAHVGTVSMRSLLVHHKDLLLASVAAVTARGTANRQLEEDNRRLRAAALAELATSFRLPLHSMRGSVRALLSDRDFASKHGRTLAELLARANELLAQMDHPLG